MKHLKIRLGDTTKRDFKVRCAQNDKNMSQVIEYLVKAYIKKGDKLIEEELHL